MIKIINFKDCVPTIQNNIQNNWTEIELNNVFTKSDIIDFLVDRRDFLCKDDSYFLSLWDEEKLQKTATEKWNSLTINEKKDVVCKWAETFLEALIIEKHYLPAN